MKLSKIQLMHLRVLNEQKDLKLIATLQKEYTGLRAPTFHSLVKKGLARIRKTEGRKDRVQITIAGINAVRKIVKTPLKHRGDYCC